MKTISVKHWEHSCGKCGGEFHVEEDAARMAPDAPLYVAPGEYPFSVLDRKKGVICPHCGHTTMVNLGKGKNKKVELSLLVHPQWLAGSSKQGAEGLPYGGSAQDDVAATMRWDIERASKIRLLEVRGTLPAEVTCPETKITFKTDTGTVPKKSNYACAACGTVQDVLTTVKATSKTAPMAAYVIQGYSPKRDAAGAPYNGRFFAKFAHIQALQYDSAAGEWESRKNGDLAHYWPKQELYRYERGNTSMLYNQPQHGHTHWWTMFNPRQLLVHSQLLKAISEVGSYEDSTREYVLAAFQQYLRNQNMYCFWNMQADKMEPHFSNNNYHPKSNVIENCVFSPLGRGNWRACTEGLTESLEWKARPWDLISVESLKRLNPALAEESSGKSEKASIGDTPLGGMVHNASSTDLNFIESATLDMVITDPPFGALIHYSDLADFFYPWLQLALKRTYKNEFASAFTPKSIEVVSNKGLEDEPDVFYQRLLTQCWSEAHRVLKPGGILAFTFHHSADDPWVAVLESLFDAGFYLEATYPIRSDETKGDGAKSR